MKQVLGKEAYSHRSSYFNFPKHFADLDLTTRTKYASGEILLAKQN